MLVDGIIHLVPVGADDQASRRVADMMRSLHAAEVGAHTTSLGLIHAESLAGRKWQLWDAEVDSAADPT